MRDLTQGKPMKVILFFTIPLLVGNLFQQFYLMADTLIVGRFLGVKALAAVGSTGSISFLIIGFAQGLTAGLSILTAQRYGARDERGVRRSFMASIKISLYVGLVLTLISVFFLKDILRWMKTPEEILGDAYTFSFWLFGGILITVFFNLLSNIIRALGDSRTPLFFLIIASVVNVVLDILFIVPFKMGVGGAAIATLIAQAVATLLCVWHIWRQIPVLHLTRKSWQVTKEEMRDHYKIGLPMAFQASIIAIGAIVLQTALNGLGSDAVAAFTAAGKIDQIATQPMMSFGITMATFAAQNYGAKKYQRILDGVRDCLWMSGGFSLLGGGLIIWQGHRIVGLFLDKKSEVVLAYAQTYFNIVCSCYLALAILFIIRYTLQGLGQSMVPTLAGVAELIMRSVAAITLAQSFGFAGVSWANVSAWFGSVAVLLYSYIKTIRKLRQKELDQRLEKVSVVE